MSLSARLGRLERQTISTTGTDSPEWQGSVRRWVGLAARGESPGPDPPAPAGVPSPRWADAVWARATWCIRLARRLPADAYLDGLSPLARRLVDHLARDAADRYALMVAVPGFEAEDWPAFLSQPVPEVEPDDEADRLNALTSFAEDLSDVAADDLDVLLRLGTAALGQLRIPAAGEVAPDGAIYFDLRFIRRPWWVPTKTPITLTRPAECHDG